MTPDASDWRSSKTYERIEVLTASDLAWEWLRRNEDYDKDYQTLVGKDDLNPLAEEIQQRWGLRFPGEPAARSTRSIRPLARAGRYKRRHSQ